MPKASKKTLKNKLDKLVSEIVRSKGYCVRCHKNFNLQCAHIVSRSNLAVRWDLDNVLPLCPDCHINFAHKNPILFAEFVREYLGEYKYEALKHRASAIKKWTVEEMQEYYQMLTRLKALGKG